MLEYEGDEEAEEENRHSHVTVVPLITPSSSSSSSFVRRIRESRLPLPSSSPHRETHASLLRRATHLTRPHSSLSLNRCPVKRVFQSDKERLRLLAEPRKDQTFNHCSFTSSSSPSAIPSPPLTQMHLAQQSSNEDVIYTNISNDIDRLRLILTLPECLPLKRKLPYHFRPRTVSSSSPSSPSIEYLTRYRINPAGSNSLLHLYEYSSVNFICFVFNFHMEVLAILDLSTGKQCIDYKHMFSLIIFIGTSRSIDGIVLSPDYIQRRRKVLASDRSRGNAFEIIFEDLPADIFAIVPVVQYATPFLTSMGASNLSSELFIRKNEPSDRTLRGQRECDGLSPLTTASNFESSIRKTTMPITAWTGSFDENDFSERSVLVECVPESCIEASIQKEWSKLITSTTDLDSETGTTNSLEADHQQVP